VAFMLYVWGKRKIGGGLMTGDDGDVAYVNMQVATKKVGVATSTDETLNYARTLSNMNSHLHVTPTSNLVNK